jgi:hypothetical protein
VDLSSWGLSNRGKFLPQVHGIFGAETLARGGAIIDFAQRRLWLSNRGSWN